MLKYIWVMIFFLFILTACQSDNQTNNKQAPPSSTISERAVNHANNESKKQVQSLENKLVPPNFSITLFEMNYLEDKNELLFKMGYEINPEIYEILTKGNQEIHFILEYPESIVDILNESHSDVIIAEKPSNNNSKYQVTFTKKIELVEAEVAKIKENITGFNLLIADSEKDIISQFIDLYGYNQYNPETSNNTNLK